MIFCTSLLASPDGRPSTFAYSATRRCSSCRLMICGDVVSTISATCRSGTIRASPSGPFLVVLRYRLLKSRGEPAAVLRQLHVHLVILAVRPEPVAHRVAGEQRPDRRPHLLHRDPDVGRGIVVEPDRQRGRRGLLGRLEVGDALHRRDLLRELVDQRREHLGIRAQQVDPHRPIEAEGELDPGNRLQLLPDRRLRSPSASGCARARSVSFRLTRA